MREIASPLSGPFTTFGQTPIDIYKVGAYRPELAYSFYNEYYRRGRQPVNFLDAITHAASSNATMVDSDGLLKWRPHNLLTYSEDFSASVWSKTNTTVTANAAVAPDGTQTADKIIASTSVASHRVIQSNTSDGAKTFSAYIKPAGYSWAILQTPVGYAWFDVQNGVVGTETSITGSIEQAENGFYKCTVTSSSAASGVFSIWAVTQNGQTNYAGDGTSGIYLWGAHLYRSDLGGMVNNPDSGDSYVPTTSSARYLPRRGHHVYNGISWVNEGLLHESEARTNLLTYSEDFTNAAWTKGGSTATLALDAIGPDGQSNSAVTLIDNAAGGTGADVEVHLTQTVSVSTTYTASIFAKAGGASRLGFYTQAFTTPTLNAGVIFDLSAGSVVNNEVGFTSTVQDFGNGWYRCSATFTTDAADTSGRIYWTVLEDTATTFPGSSNTVNLDGTSSVLIYGAQFEQGSTPSSYIPTSGATVTRAAETLTVPAANLPYSATAMSIQMDGRMTYADTGTVISADGVSGEVVPYSWTLNSSNYISAQMDTLTSGATGQLNFLQEANGVVDLSLTSSNYFSPGINVPFNIASRHGSTFINGAVDGVALTENTTPAGLPDLSTTDLELGYTFMGTIKKFRMWADDIGDTGIEEASTNA